MRLKIVKSSLLVFLLYKITMLIYIIELDHLCYVLVFKRTITGYFLALPLLNYATLNS